MCKSCLEKDITRIDEDILTLINDLRDTDCACECCIEYIKLLLSVCEDLKIMVLTKLKLLAQVCPNGFIKLSNFDAIIQNRITEKLSAYTEMLFEKKEEMNDEQYLLRMNTMKELNDQITTIERRYNS